MHQSRSRFMLWLLLLPVAWQETAGRLLRHTGSTVQPPSDGLPYRQKLENHMNMQYHGTLNIGGQSVPAIFDTGSFELIVMSTRCKECPMPIYDPEKSKTFKSSKGNETVEHFFGSGSTKSELGYEDVKVGPLLASGQAFYQMVDHDMNVLDSASFDAIVGIAPEGHNMTEKSLLENLHVTEYSLCLEAADGAPGWLIWGSELSQSQKTSMAAALPVVGRHHWAVSLQSLMPAMQLSDEQVKHAETLFCGRGCAAVLDSGTSLIAAPVSALHGLEILLPKLHANCSNFHELPDIELVMGGYKVLLPPEAYAVRLRGSPKEKQQAGSLLHFMAAESSDSNDECVYGFMEVNRHTDFGPLWIFGMPFFRLFHTTFSNAPEPEDRRIFLMDAADDCTPQAPHLEVVQGASQAEPEFQGKAGAFPKMAVFNSARPARENIRGPLTLEAKDLRPPPILQLFDML